MAEVITLNDENFDKTIKEHETILVDFWAEWCAPCRAIAPVLEEIAKENNITIGKLNIDENPVKAAEFQVLAIPTLILFKEGKAVARIVGAMPKDAIMKKIKEYI